MSKTEQQSPCLALQLAGHMAQSRNKNLRKAATNLSRIERLRARPMTTYTIAGSLAAYRAEQAKESVFGSH